MLCRALANVIHRALNLHIGGRDLGVSFCRSILFQNRPRVLLDRNFLSGCAFLFGVSFTSRLYAPSAGIIRELA